MLSPGPALYEGKGDDMFTKLQKKQAIHVNMQSILDHSDSLKNVMSRNSLSMSRKRSMENLVKSSS